MKAAAKCISSFNNIFLPFLFVWRPFSFCSRLLPMSIAEVGYFLPNSITCIFKMRYRHMVMTLMRIYCLFFFFLMSGRLKSDYARHIRTRSKWVPALFPFSSGKWEGADSPTVTARLGAASPLHCSAGECRKMALCPAQIGNRVQLFRCLDLGRQLKGTHIDAARKY